MQSDRIEQIMNPNVIEVSPDTSVSNTVREMRKNGVSSILVLQHQKPVGIFTERDIVRSVASGGPKFEETIEGIMTTPVITIGHDASLYDAHHHFSTYDIHHLAVVDAHHRAVGVVTPTDVLQHLNRSYFRNDVPVSRVMHNVAITVSAKRTVFQALSEMAQKRLDCVLVSENHKPIGIFTERDAASLMLKRPHVLKQQVKVVMRTPVHTVGLTTSLKEAGEVIQQRGLRRLVVVDDAGGVIGLINQSTLIKGLENHYIDALRRKIVRQGAEIERLRRRLATYAGFEDGVII